MKFKLPVSYKVQNSCSNCKFGSDFSSYDDPEMWYCIRGIKKWTWRNHPSSDREVSSSGICKYHIRWRDV